MTVSTLLSPRMGTSAAGIRQRIALKRLLVEQGGAVAAIMSPSNFHEEVEGLGALPV